MWQKANGSNAMKKKTWHEIGKAEEQKPNQKFGQYKKTAKIVLAQKNIVTGMDPEEKNEAYEDKFEENSIVTMDTLRISSVIMTDSRMRSMHVSIPIVLKTIRGNKPVETKVLLDTGAEGLFMDKNYAEEHDVVLQKLPNPITPSNIDGTLNHAGQITHFTWIQAKIDKRKLLEKLWITNLGSSDVICGFPWFKEDNPQIVWKTGRVQLPKADLDTTFLYLAKDKQMRKEIEEQKEFRKGTFAARFIKKRKEQQSTENEPRNPLIEEKQRLGQFSKMNIPQKERAVQPRDKNKTQTEYMAKRRCFGCHEIGHMVRDCPEKERESNQSRTTQFNEIETRTEPESISPDWRQRRQNKGKSPMMGNPLTRRTERITKQSDKPDWRSQK